MTESRPPDPTGPRPPHPPTYPATSGPAGDDYPPPSPGWPPPAHGISPKPADAQIAPDYGPRPYRPEASAQVRKGRGQAAFRWLLVVVLGIHTAAAFTQSILAGTYMSGSLDSMAIHGAIGSGLTALTMVQGVVALLFFFPGRGPVWPLLVSILLFFVEGFQVGMGYARTLGIHIPLGVAIIMTVTGMFVWSLRWKPKGPKAGRR